MVVSHSIWHPLESALEHWLIDNDGFDINGSFLPQTANNPKAKFSDEPIICIVVKDVEKEVADKLKAYLEHQRITCTVVRNTLLGPFIGWFRLLPIVAQMGLFMLAGSWVYLSTTATTSRGILLGVVPLLLFLFLLILTRRFPTILFPVRSAY